MEIYNINPRCDRSLDNVLLNLVEQVHIKATQNEMYKFCIEYIKHDFCLLFGSPQGNHFFENGWSKPNSGSHRL